MIAQQFTRTRSRFVVSLILLFSIPLLIAAAEDRADDRGDTRQLKTFFEVTIRQGPSAGIVANGVLTLHVQPHSGNFTGTLTPGIDESTGEPQSSVLFHQVDHKFVAFGDIKELQVRGSIRGHAVNLIALNVSGEGKNLFGVGTTENAFGEPSEQQGLGNLAGPAVGPEEGDSGDWIATTVQPIPFHAPPTITSAATTTFKTGTPNSFVITTSGVPGPSITEVGALPAGVALASNGVLSGNPTTIGTFPIAITAANGFFPDGTQNFTLVVVRPEATFDSVLSPNPVNVAAWSIGTGTCHLNTCSHLLSMIVSPNDNSSTDYSAFIANARTALTTAKLFTGTLASGDLTIASAPSMRVAGLNFQAGPNNTVVASVTISYP